MTNTMSIFSEKSALADRWKGHEDSVWVSFDELDKQHNPLNLGSGTSLESPHREVTDSIVEAARHAEWWMHQYTSSYGHPRLVKALEQLYSPRMNRIINGDTDLLVTYGAQEGITCVVMSLINPGDEVILFEPCFDCYVPLIQCVGGIVKAIPVRLDVQTETVTSKDWHINFEELESLFNSKTKMIVLNSPQNPTGKVYTREECTKIADLCKKWGVIVLSDEVYEWMVYEPSELFKIATIPGMWDQTITLGSAGKAYHVTGWKTGWAIGPPSLINSLRIAHQHMVYSCSTPLQEAVGEVIEKDLPRLGKPDCLLTKYLVGLFKKRNFLAKGLSNIGMTPSIPDGGYFIVADFSKFVPKIDLSKESYPDLDFKFATWMVKHLKIMTIPGSTFYCKVHKSLGNNFVRMCFFRELSMLKEAVDIFEKWANSLK